MTFIYLQFSCKCNILFIVRGHLQIDFAILNFIMTLGGMGGGGGEGVQPMTL